MNRMTICMERERIYGVSNSHCSKRTTATRVTEGTKNVIYDVFMKTESMFYDLHVSF